MAEIKPISTLLVTTDVNAGDQILINSLAANGTDFITKTIEPADFGTGIAGYMGNSFLSTTGGDVRGQVRIDVGDNSASALYIGDIDGGFDAPYTSILGGGSISVAGGTIDVARRRSTSFDPTIDGSVSISVSNYSNAVFAAYEYGRCDMRGPVNIGWIDDGAGSPNKAGLLNLQATSAVTNATPAFQVNHQNGSGDNIVASLNYGGDLVAEGISTLGGIQLGTLTELSNSFDVTNTLNFGGDMSMFHMTDGTFGVQNRIVVDNNNLYIGTRSDGGGGGSSYYTNLIVVDVGNDAYSGSTAHVKLGYGGTTGGTKLETTDTGITVTGDVTPSDNGTEDLGADTKRWQDVYVKDGVDFIDKRTATNAILSVRDGQIILTNSTDEVTTAVDLGGTTPDPGHIRNVELDGTGRYAVGPSTLANTNGLITREFINTPGQFFVINDIDGGSFTGGNRQCFGLVRETIVDGSDLSGRTEGLFTGGNSGGWSTGPFWYYTGGYPYIWTSYSIAAQTPQGSGETYAGTFGNQNTQRAWWGACTTLGLGKKYRVGIANGTSSDATGANFSNRLIHQLYVHQEIIDDATVLATLPANVATYGAGWYTCWATNGDYENMGQFPGDSTGYAASRQAGVDKGYRFRWSTFGNTTLNQLPYLLGVPTINDQIAAATGLSYYLVYEPTAADLAAANVTLASGTTSAENTFYTSKQVALLQFQQPYTDWETSTDNVFDINHTELGAVQSSPLFVTYPVTTSEEIIEAGLSVQGIESIRATVSGIILQAVIGYYMVRQLDATDRATVRTQFAEITNAANTGQLQQVHDLVANITPDPLYPQELIDALLERTSFYLKNFPVF